MAGLLVSLALGTGCLEPPAAPPPSSATAPADATQAGAAQLARDEAHVRKQARESAYRIDRSGLSMTDPALETYLLAVATHVAGRQLAAEGFTPRVVVLKDADMNAFAFADGSVYVHTALLAHMENEAQLATVLAREYAHVLKRHALAQHRATRDTGNLIATTSAFAGVVPGGGELNLLLQLGAWSSMAGYPAVLESEADVLGLELLAEAGYDVNQAPRLFELTVEYLQAVQAQRPGDPPPFAMSRPAHVTARIDGYRKRIAREYAAEAADPNRLVRADEFSLQVRPVMVEQAALELDRGRFDSAAATLDRALALGDDDPRAWVMLGEARVRSNTAPDADAGVAAYRQALVLDPDHAGAHRALGLHFYRVARASQGDASAPEVGSARRHLAAYLRAAPDAPDRAYVRRYVEQLDTGAATASAPR